MIELVLWQKVVLYGLLLISIFIFVKTSQLKINNRPVIKLKYRLLLALFFPVIFVLAFTVGAILIAIVATIIFIFILSSYFKKRNRPIMKNKIIIRRF